jgi:asparagine synthase (glutamine-hydrolysing)
MGQVCGIAGILSSDGPVDPAAVERMCSAMEHRGPDSRGKFDGPGVSLGVQRLAVIDLESGDQPIANEDGSLVVVCNGEIYNYGELRDELARGGHRFRTKSDTEVIVHLYEEMGDACVGRLRGMFAFALWDGRAGRLLLARDRVGKKPLFYSHEGTRLAFASELPALMSSREVSREIDYDAIDTYLHYQVVPGPRSAFRAVRKLPPAHTLSWTRGEASLKRYWRLSYQDGFDGDEEQACEQIREAVLEATRLRLRSDVPVGALLSGGVDSSAVVAAMARLTTEPVKTFSIGFDVDEFDETDSARQVAELYGAEHHRGVVDSSALDDLPRLAALAELAGGEVTVALNGDGGDESFAGYTRYRRFATPGTRDPELEPYEEYARRRSTSYFSHAEREALYDPEFAEIIADPRLGQFEAQYAASDAETVVERLLDVDVQSYLPDDLLVKMDIATMAHSLEARSPLLDPGVMELAASLPLRMKLSDDGEAKRIFKRAMAQWLPEGILHREKMGFRIPFGEWLRADRRDLAPEVLLDGRSLERGIFREDRVRAIVSEHLDGGRDHGYRIWTLLMLELWFRAYVDREPAGKPPAPLGLST